MSLGITLFPLAIMAISTAVTFADLKKSVEQESSRVTCRIETRYNDTGLLCKTLNEHGLTVEIANDSVVKASCLNSSFVFRREYSNQSFNLVLNSKEEIQTLQKELKQLEEEYSLNVQSFTYEKIKSSLESDMSIESEEVLEDNSILLTINLE